MKKSYNSKSLFTKIALIVVLISALTITSCSLGGGKNNSEDQEKNATKYSVATPYCEIKYPETWKEQITVENNEADGILSYAFYATINESQYKLYTVYFGSSKAGNLLGYISNSGNKVPVYIECHKLTSDDGLTEDELHQFYSMMDGVNEVVQSIASASGYQAA